MKIAVKIAFMAAATIPAAASAQEAGRMLSLDEAVAVTLTENPALKAAAYEERAAQQQRRAFPFEGARWCAGMLCREDPELYLTHRP